MMRKTNLKESLYRETIPIRQSALPNCLPQSSILHKSPHILEISSGKAS